MKRFLTANAVPLGGIVVVAVVLAVAPAVLSTFTVGLFAKYLCWAIAAVGIGIAWGRGGMLVLGQGLYFGLGAYAMAMHLKFESAGPSGVPDFMQLYAGGHVPVWWEPFRSAGFTLLAVLVLPALVATVIGYAVLKRRVKDAYFAILSQALAAAFAIWLIGQIKQTGGFNGLNDFTSFFGFDLYDPLNQVLLFQIVGWLLVVALLLAFWLYRSRYGELLVAVRDHEERVRFLGHDPANIKLVAYVVAAFLAGLGGAMFAPVVGIIAPSNIDAPASILLVAGVALGGRASLFGPALGAVVMGFAQSRLSDQFPTFWLYLEGALFIVVILFLPAGLASLRLRGASLRLREASLRLRGGSTKEAA